jgi:endogenous inhibitor of DNA gyrase (YacG/DUF329 family)
MMMREFEVGDRVAINIGIDEADPFEGEVVAVLDLPGWAFKNYVVALETEMDPLLEVRSGNRLSPWDCTDALGQ